MSPQPLESEDQQSRWQHQEAHYELESSLTLQPIEEAWWNDPTSLTPPTPPIASQPRRKSSPSKSLRPQPIKPWWKLEAQQTLLYARERLVANLCAEIEEADEPTTTEEANRIVRQARTILAILKSDANAQSERPIPVDIYEEEEVKVSKWVLVRRMVRERRGLFRRRGS